MTEHKQNQQKKRLTLNDIRSLKKHEKIGKIGRGILTIAGTAGFIAVALMAPNVLALFDGKEQRQKEWYFKKTLENLKHKGLLKQTKRDNKIVYELTNKGEELAAGYAFGETLIDKPSHWDGKWRLVISDIPEWRKAVREELRSSLAGLGFVPLQKSVWVFPYPCAEVIALVKKKYDVGKEILYLEVDLLENDHWLRDIFYLR